MPQLWESDKWAEEFVAAQPSRDAALEAAWFFLEEPKKHEETESYWFMYVCVGSIQDLVPLMDKADCAAVADKLGKLYKKRERMPVQEKAYKMLLKAAK